MTTNTDDDRAGWTQMGLDHVPGTFMYHVGHDILSDRSVRVVDGINGGWDIVLRIDGGYSLREDADDIAASYQAEVVGIAYRMRVRPQEHNSGEVTDLTCPVCSKAALYTLSTDRYFHIDGSTNDPCWVALLRDSDGALTRGTPDPRHLFDYQPPTETGSR